jgi:predicted  nucleic acid-binding Zn-ribbon protein
MAKLEIELSEFDALRDAKNKAEDELKEAKQTHKEEITDLKSVIKGLERKSRVIIKHENKYFCRTALDEEILKKLKWNLTCSCSKETSNLIDMVYLWKRGDYGAYQILDKCADIIANELKHIFVEAPECVIPICSEYDEPDQYIGFDDVKVEVEKELKDQYINNQKKIKEKLEQQIQDYENKYKNVDAELQTKYDERIRVLEGNLINSKGEVCSLKETHKEEVDKLKETHKEEVDKLKDDIKFLEGELKEAQKTQKEKILEAEEKLKEAQEVLNKLTNKSNKKWYQFWK